MSNYNLLQDKRAQVAETITWVVATLVIIFLLIASIYFSSILGKSKNVSKDDIKTYNIDETWSQLKTNMAYIVNSENKEKIEVWIRESENDK